MDRKRIAKKSSIIGLISQIILSVVAFISRKLFLDVMGIEYLGISSTFSQILGTLALSEMGIQVVIIYKLFKPMVDSDYNAVQKIMSAFRTLYFGIAGIIFSGAILVLPFLKFILKNVTVSWDTIYLVWLLMAISAAGSYLLSYNRALFYADQQEYIIKYIDLFCSVVFTSIKIITILVWENFILYVTLDIICMITTNILIYTLRKRKYNWLYYSKVDMVFLKDLFVTVKDVFAGKMASYVFNSTDDLVISSLIGTSIVGMVGNYTTITIAIRAIITAIASPIQNLTGNYLVNKNDKDISGFFSNYVFILYLIISILLIPTYLLIDDFVVLFYGKQYHLNRLFIICLVICCYTELMQIPAGALADGSGLFADQKKFYYTSALLNIFISIIGALTIGISGVIAGTIIGNLYNWFMRTYISFYKVIETGKIDMQKHLVRNFIYGILFLIIPLIFGIVFNNIWKETTIVIFIIKGIISIIGTVFTIFFVFRNTKEVKYLVGFIRNR